MPLCSPACVCFLVLFAHSTSALAGSRTGERGSDDGLFDDPVGITVLGLSGEVAVTDRETGELGVQSDTWELGGRRPVYAEVIYATELGSSNRRLSVFSRQQLSGDEQVTEFSAATSGMRFEMRF